MNHLQIYDNALPKESCRNIIKYFDNNPNVNEEYGLLTITFENNIFNVKINNRSIIYFKKYKNKSSRYKTFKFVNYELINIK